MDLIVSAKRGIAAQVSLAYTKGKHTLVRTYISHFNFFIGSYYASYMYTCTDVTITFQGAMKLSALTLVCIHSILGILGR